MLDLALVVRMILSLLLVCSLGVIIIYGLARLQRRSGKLSNGRGDQAEKVDQTKKKYKNK